MRKLLSIPVLALWVLVAPSLASAGVLVPTVEFLVDGNSVATLPVSAAGDGTYFIENWTLNTSEFQVTLSAFLDPDPLILFAGSVIDFGAPSTFGFIFSQAIVPTAAPGSVRSSFSASTTSSGPMTVTPGVPPGGIPVDSDGTPEVMVFALSQNGGTTFVSADIDLGPLAVLSAPSDTYGPFAEGFIPGPSGGGSYDFMTVALSFGLGGGNEAFTFNGDAEVVVPEPTTLGLLGLGLAALALRRRAS